MSANVLSERCGVSNGYIGRIPKKLLNPKADVGHRVLEKLCAVTETNFGWLSTGDGRPNAKAWQDYPPEENELEDDRAPTKSDILPRSPFGDAPAAEKLKRRRRGA